MGAGQYSAPETDRCGPGCVAFGQTGRFARGNLLHGRQGRDDLFHGQLGLKTLECGDGGQHSFDAAELANNLFS